MTNMPVPQCHFGTNPTDCKVLLDIVDFHTELRSRTTAVDNDMYRSNISDTDSLCIPNTADRKHRKNTEETEERQRDSLSQLVRWNPW
jgi:hypothetical protein